MANWFYPEDRTRPVIDPERQIASKYPDMPLPKLPARAVVFCLGRVPGVLQERFPTRMMMEKLPGFITHSPVWCVEDHPEVCFLHGGYGAPAVTCTVETLRVLGVEEVFLVGLAGGFCEDTQVGDVLLPPAIWSEEGVSRHYLEDPGFAQVDSPRPLTELADCFREKGFTAKLEKTVSTDAVYRQTFYKETLWREKGCVAVDMEASALVNLCNVYRLKSTVALMVSDRHPLTESSPKWVWGGGSFAALRDDFIETCISVSL